MSHKDLKIDEEIEEIVQAVYSGSQAVEEVVDEASGNEEINTENDNSIDNGTESAAEVSRDVDSAEIDEVATEEPATEEPATEEPASGEPETEESETDESETDETEMDEAEMDEAELEEYTSEAAANLEKFAEDQSEEALEEYTDEAAANLEKFAENQSEEALEEYTDEAAANLEKFAKTQTEEALEQYIDESADKTSDNVDEILSGNNSAAREVTASELGKAGYSAFAEGMSEDANSSKKKKKKKKSEASGEDAEKDYYNEIADEGQKNPHKALWIVIAIVVGLIVIAYVSGIIYFSKHFGANSMVNGVDCSFMNAEEVESIIAGQVEEYSLEIIERKDKTEIINGVDVGLEYVPDGQVSQLILDQNAVIWPYRFFAESLADQNTYTSVKLDEDMFIAALDSLDCLNEDKMIAPVDSYPALDGALYIAYPEEEGTTITDREEVSSAIRDAILGTIEFIDLEEEGYYLNPELTTESKEVTDIVEKYNEYVGLTITYHFGDETEVLDGATTNAWFTWDDKMNATLNKDAVKAWTREFGKKHDTMGTQRTFKNPAGLDITVSGGLYGWSVDEDAEYKMILQMYEDMESQDREPIWEQTAASFTEGQDFGDTYIEVNLNTQHMIFWKEGEIIFEDDVITGLPTAERQTPEGVWYILEMKQNKTLRGQQNEDGTYEYETPVAYWMRVTWTGVGFHDATWQYTYGPDVYTYRGSHGCINMKYASAQTLYGLTWVGCPVIIHR